MKVRITMIGAVLAACVTSGCSSGNAPAVRCTDDGALVSGPHGYARLPGVNGKWVRSALMRTAEAERWERVRNNEGSSVDSAGKHGLVRLEYVYRDPDGREIRFDWHEETGHDPVLLVSADAAIRERVTSLVGANIIRLRDGKGLATGL